MIRFLLSTVFFHLLFTGFGQNGRLISECTIVYELSVDDQKANEQMMQAFNGATKIVYIKGTKTRSDVISPSYTQTTIFDTKTDSTIILRDLGNNKYISFLTRQQRRERNKKFEGIKFTITSDTKIILGYQCKKAVATLSDGTAFNVFYTPLLIPSVREYDYQFKDLPGLALQYDAESEDGTTRVHFTAVKISLTPVPAVRFDLPKAGYRIL